MDLGGAVILKIDSRLFMRKVTETNKQVANEGAGIENHWPENRCGEIRMLLNRSPK